MMVGRISIAVLSVAVLVAQYAETLAHAQLDGQHRSADTARHFHTAPLLQLEHGARSHHHHGQHEHDHSSAQDQSALADVPVIGRETHDHDSDAVYLFWSSVEGLPGVNAVDAGELLSLLGADLADEIAVHPCGLSRPQQDPVASTSHGPLYLRALCLRL